MSESWIALADLPAGSVGDAGEGDFEAEAFGPGDVVRSEVLVAHAGLGSSSCKTFNWVLATAT